MSRQVQDAYIVAASRTPIGRAPKGTLRNVRPDDLLVHAIRSALAQVPGLDPAAITAGLGIWLQRLQQGIVSPLGKLRKACYRHCYRHSCWQSCGHWSIGFWNWLALALRQRSCRVELATGVLTSRLNIARAGLQQAVGARSYCKSRAQPRYAWTPLRSQLQ